MPTSDDVIEETAMAIDEKSVKDGDNAKIKAAYEPAGKIENGAIQAIAGAATTMLALQIAFLGYWAFGSETAKNPWQLPHLIALVPMVFAFVNLTRVPFLATATGIDPASFNRVRNIYRNGMLFLGTGLALAMILSIGAVLDGIVALIERCG